MCVFALSSSWQDMSKSVQEFKMNGPAKETGQRDNMVAFEECVSQIKCPISTQIDCPRHSAVLCSIKYV